MGLADIVEKTDASIGREKQDAPAVTTVAEFIALFSSGDLDHVVPAAEYERLKDAVIAVQEAVGLGDGSTTGSLEARVQGLLGGSADASDLTITSADPLVTIANEATGGIVLIQGNKTTEGGAAVALSNANSFSNTGSVQQIATLIQMVVDQPSGDAGSVGLVIAKSMTAQGAGSHKIISGRVASGALEVFAVDDHGAIFSSGWIVKPADQSVVSSVALVNDDDLVFNVVAGAKYTFRFHLFIQPVGGISGIKIGVGGTFTAVSLQGQVVCWEAGEPLLDRVSAFGSDFAVVTSDTFATVEGAFEVDTAGTFCLTFAQSVSDSDAITIQANSTLMIQRTS